MNEWVDGKVNETYSFLLDLHIHSCRIQFNVFKVKFKGSPGSQKRGFFMTTTKSEIIRDH